MDEADIENIADGKWRELNDTKLLVLFNAILIHSCTFFCANIALFDQGYQDKLSKKAMDKLVAITGLVKEFSDECEKRGIYHAGDKKTSTEPITSKKTLH